MFGASNIVRVAALGAAAIFSGAGSAGAVTASFGGSLFDYGVSHDFGDFTVTAGSAGVLNDGVPTVTRSWGGLGVNGRLDVSPYHIDGEPVGSSEWLTFGFDSTVTLTGFTLTSVDSDDEYDFYVNGELDSTSSSPSWSGAISLDEFAIGAVGSRNEGDGLPQWWTFGFGNADNFKVSSITYDVAPVPLPAAGFLLLCGLGGLAAFRRKPSALA